MPKSLKHTSKQSAHWKGLTLSQKKNYYEHLLSFFETIPKKVISVYDLHTAILDLLDI